MPPNSWEELFVCNGELALTLDCMLKEKFTDKHDCSITVLLLLVVVVLVVVILAVISLKLLSLLSSTWNHDYFQLNVSI